MKWLQTCLLCLQKNLAVWHHWCATHVLSCIPSVPVKNSGLWNQQSCIWWTGAETLSCRLTVVGLAIQTPCLIPQCIKACRSATLWSFTDPDKTPLLCPVSEIFNTTDFLFFLPNNHPNLHFYLSHDMFFPCLHSVHFCTLFHHLGLICHIDKYQVFLADENLSKSELKTRFFRQTVRVFGGKSRSWPSPNDTFLGGIHVAADGTREDFGKLRQILEWANQPVGKRKKKQLKIWCVHIHIHFPHLHLPWNFFYAFVTGVSSVGSSALSNEEKTRNDFHTII